MIRCERQGWRNVCRWVADPLVVSLLVVSLLVVSLLVVAARGDQAGQSARHVDAKLLDESLRLATQYLLSSQLPDGSFRYQVNFITGERAPEQGVVRQAGALWGLAASHQFRPSAQTRAGVLRGLAFFEKHSQCREGNRYLVYPGTEEGNSGTVALVALALIDFLRAEAAEDHVGLRKQLDEYIDFLLSLQRSDDCYYPKYLLSSGEGWGVSSSYFDGEILLALTKAARYAGRNELRMSCLKSAEAMFQKYVAKSLAEGLDAPAAKGFYQWGSMAFLEIHQAGWEGSEHFAARALAMADWMIDVHRVLQRRRNTAYALEGIASAYAIAAELNDRAAMSSLRGTAERMLLHLTAWQVGGPLPSAYLQQHEDYDSSCRGGVLGADGNPWLRIDTTQHQMHAVILCRQFLWP